jgi:dihydrofolate reductase
MRKVVLTMQVTIDGFVATKDGALDWMWIHFNDALKQRAFEAVSRVSTHVMGRRTYLAQAATWPNSNDPMGSLVNRAQKVVFSRTLDHLEWENSRLATADLAQELAALKRQDGGDIAITGGAQLAQSASREGLVDEYQLVVHPIALGEGLALFADLERPLQLELVDSERFDTGVERVVLRPINPHTSS